MTPKIKQPNSSIPRCQRAKRFSGPRISSRGSRGHIHADLLFFALQKRRAELAMYVLPRALESAWSSARKRAWVPLVPFGETMLGAAAMAMVMDAYKHQPNALSGVVRKLLFQLVGPV